MEPYLQQLQKVLDNLEGIDYSRLGDHHSRSWVQTTVAINRNGKAVSVGILDHLDEEGLSAKLYPVNDIKSEFPWGQKTHVRDMYRSLKRELKKLGYNVQELNEPVVAHIMAW